MARMIISSESVNSYGTWIVTDGIDLTQFKKNPIMLYMHKRGCVIGTIQNLKVENNELTGEPVFDEVREESQFAKKQLADGTLKMCSGWFEPLETSDDPKLTKPGQWMFTVTKCRLNEVSIVDIGGNDDAMVLAYNGIDIKDLKLSEGGVCAALPALQKNNAQNKEKSMGVIEQKLGFTDKMSEIDKVNQIDLILGYKAENEKLQKQLTEMVAAGIADAVDGAIKAGKFTEDKKEQFLALGKKVGIADLKLTLSAMASIAKPSNIINGLAAANTSDEREAWTKLSEVPSEQLMKLRKEDKATYAKLYKAEFGFDCPVIKD